MLSRASLALLVVVTGAIAGGSACGSSKGSTFDGGGGDGGPDGSIRDGSTPRGDGPGSLGGGGDGSTKPLTGPLSISPTGKTLTVPFGTHTPTLTFSAKVGKTSVPASFTVDLGQVAAINAASGVLTPSGTVGGIVNVTATFQGQKVSTKVTVLVQLQDNGAAASGDGGVSDAGNAGGNGGVGGSNAGGPVSAATQKALTGTATADTGLAWLYPYDQTVWPQGVLPPLLQWAAPRTYDSVYIHLKEAGAEYQGFFSAPVAGQPFINVPISKTAWDTLLFSNQGEPLVVTLTFAAGGVAYGPLTETWTIAQGTLTGTVYYNSYGTALAKNLCCTGGGANAEFGGATLSIKHGALGPSLVAGATGGDSACRVCHSVSANGATLTTSHGDDYDEISAYALTAANAETVMSPANGEFAFAALSPDGTSLFSNTGPLPGISGMPATSGLFSVPSGAPIATTGLPAGLGAATPSFSPDGQHVAFNNYSTDKVSIASLDFAAGTSTFSNLRVLHTPAAGTTDVFPAFLPTNDAVVFEHETVNGGEFGATRNNARGELWWADLATQTAAPLATLNGGAYLPTGPNNHTDDATLDYEPTVNPVPSGGYAWVVFTSRRLYGNVATQDPFLSDPRKYDPSKSATTKKLWVAAIDLNAAPGTDPSHPAFYLPGQELLACNSRGYWVVDPCAADGASCLTGDQCCGGYCAQGDGGFVCGTPPAGCSAISNKCTTSADCCGSASGIVCIDGFCAQSTPPPPP
jgi:hypothetical protein